MRQGLTLRHVAGLDPAIPIGWLLTGTASNVMLVRFAAWGGCFAIVWRCVSWGLMTGSSQSGPAHDDGRVLTVGGAREGRTIARIASECDRTSLPYGLASRRPWSCNVRKVFSAEEKGDDVEGHGAEWKLRFARSALNPSSVASSSSPSSSVLKTLRTLQLHGRRDARP